MALTRLAGDDSFEMMKPLVEQALDDPSVTVFQVLGYYGIGKRRAVREILEKKGITPIEHNYSFVEDVDIILKPITENPDAVHLWDDVFRSIIFTPAVLKLFKDLESGKIPFDGKFLLVANDQEFSPPKYPPFAGVHIDNMDPEFIYYRVYQEMKAKGYSEEDMKPRLLNLALKLHNK